MPCVLLLSLVPAQHLFCFAWHSYRSGYPVVNMPPFSSPALNLDGSDDPFYRYKMPALQVKVEGSSKMVKTVLLNLDDVCRAIGRPCDHMLVFLGQNLSAAANVDKRTGKTYISGAHEQATVQQHVFQFLQDTVLCGRCGNPETTLRIEGSKKKKGAHLTCKGCGACMDLDATDRFVKYMILHPPEDAAYGHADAGGGNVHSQLQEEVAASTSDRKKVPCGQCGHRTSKAICSKCGAATDAAAAAGFFAHQCSDERHHSKEQAGGTGKGAKKECPSCGHRTSKASCNKCGASLAD